MLSTLVCIVTHWIVHTLNHDIGYEVIMIN